MKIAAISDDETTISQHFGRASLYVVATIENGEIINKETRDKTGHHTFAGGGSESAHSEGHGYGRHAQAKHASMARTIDDCQVLIAGGMGQGAYENLKNLNIEPVVTDVKNIDEAVQLYLDGKLTNLMERLH